VAKSVLISNRTAAVARYGMLETIRQYGHEQLTSGKEAVVRCRHRDYYLRLAERSEAESDWLGCRQLQWLDRFHTEAGNLRAALEFCLTEPGQARTALRMSGALYWYWVTRAVRDGRHWLDQALAHDTAPSRERAQALWTVGRIAAAQGDTAYALSVLEECLDLARRFDDEALRGYALQFIGQAKWLQGNSRKRRRRMNRHWRTTGPPAR
jgi:non-specific serine/threonine protein kinase